MPVCANVPRPCAVSVPDARASNSTTPSTVSTAARRQCRRARPNKSRPSIGPSAADREPPGTQKPPRPGPKNRTHRPEIRRP
ncbi:hypothetical protein ACCO45_006503 [Purpureocillium lilacinum]|uniref:Uncharacterized protein n=1 Tax=Purpureocillium lilacinum TaxID=33203 RepID=A0ACC4DQ11_PURLI